MLVVIIIIHSAFGATFFSNMKREGKGENRNNGWVLREKVSENFHATSLGDGRGRTWSRSGEWEIQNNFIFHDKRVFLCCCKG
jgi:hypothetical protein